ncbi:MAG: hypothetical protein MHPSP_002323, partial [Paramarteilia canceri]
LRKQMTNNINEICKNFKSQMDLQVYDSVRGIVGRFKGQERIFSKCQNNLDQKAQELMNKEIELQDKINLNEIKGKNIQMKLIQEIKLVEVFIILTVESFFERILIPVNNF